MKFLLILFIVVLLIQIIKYLSTKENFDNNCFYNFKPNFTLKMSDLCLKQMNDTGDISTLTE